MFWDIAANFYDIFENYYNGEVNRKLALQVAEFIEKDDRVLECACGTGMITKAIAPKCRELIATDYSEGMLRQAKRNCASFKNVKIRRADIMKLNCKDGAFDKVVAGNVIHLLEKPYAAMDELMRACKNGGQVIIPTYVNKENSGKPSIFILFLEKFGADFKKQFDFSSYKLFMEKTGYSNIKYILVEGKMPCAIAVITKNTQVKEWENSQGIRLPKEVLKSAGISLNDFLDVTVSNGVITLVKPFRHKTLEERAAEFDGKLMLDGEYDWGEPVGREVW